LSGILSSGLINVAADYKGTKSREQKDQVAPKYAVTNVPRFGIDLPTLSPLSLAGYSPKGKRKIRKAHRKWKIYGGGACAVWVSLMSLNCGISAGQVQERTSAQINLTLSELPVWIICE